MTHFRIELASYIRPSSVPRQPLLNLRAPKRIQTNVYHYPRESARIQFLVFIKCIATKSQTKYKCIARRWTVYKLR